MKTTVREVMTSRVIWVRKDAPFRKLAAALRQHRVSAFPVVDGEGKVTGIVSEGDLLAKEALADPGMMDSLLHHRDTAKAQGITAGDLMTHPAVTVRPDDSVEHAARLMYTRKVKRLPVVDADGKLAGIISRVDVLAVFDRADEDIRQEIIDGVLGEFLVNPHDYDVKVSDGVVTLSGTPETDLIGREIVERVRHVQGVVAVRDRFTPGSRFDVVASFPSD